MDLSFGVQSGGKPYPFRWPSCTSWRKLPSTALHEFYDANSTDIAGYNPWRTRRFDDEAGCRALCENRLGCAGYSWRSADPSHPYYHECFLISHDGGLHAHNAAFEAAVCVGRAGNTTLAARGLNGTYTGTTFAAEVVRVVEEHARDYAGRPAFLYLSMHNTHAPLEAPWHYVAPYAKKFPADEKRHYWSGMVSFVDETVGNLTDALRATGMWESTLFVWTNDNGAPVYVGGSNHPLRGGKGSNWEGGVRVPGFVSGGVLPVSQRGQSTDGIIHIADWLATFCALAGLDPTAGEPHPVAPVDSINAWPWLSGREPTSRRTEVVFDHRMFLNASQHRDTCHVVNSSRAGGEACLSGAIRRNKWKLVLGPEHQNLWTGWFTPNVTDPITKNSSGVTSTACFPAPCLFDLEDDGMTEHEDRAAQQPAVVGSLMERMTQLAEEYHPPVDNPPEDLDGYCAAVAANGNFVGPWMRVAPKLL